MDNWQNNGASAPPAEEQVPRRVEEAVAAGNSQGGIPPGASVTPEVVHREMAQNIAQGEERTATPLETGGRRGVDAEKQRATEARATQADALTEQDRERQLRLATEELRIAADQ
jgi:hypothetical protein